MPAIRWSMIADAKRPEARDHGVDLGQELGSWSAKCRGRRELDLEDLRDAVRRRLEALPAVRQTLAKSALSPSCRSRRW